MDHLDELENQSIFILREAYKNFKNLAMLWSIGKDSTIMLWLARKAFLGHCPIPLVHIDTTYKIPAMIKYRDFYAKEWGLNLVVGKNQKALDEGMNHEKGRIVCCEALKTQGLQCIMEEQGTLDSFSVSAATRRALVPKSAIFRRGIKTLNGISKINHRNFGTNIKPLSQKTPIFESIPFFIGQS